MFILRDFIQSIRDFIDWGYVLAGFTGTYGYGGTFDGWLIKVNSDGMEQWNTTYGWELYDEIYAVQQTSDGGFILTGYTLSGDIFGKGDIWVIKVASEELPEFRKILLIGGIFNIMETEHYIHFNAYDVWALQFSPFSFRHFTSGELVTISKEYIGKMDENFLFGIFDAAIR